jgi:hypothetical protein
METHEKYELLCALSAARQLDLDQQRELDLHIQECGACRGALEEFEEVAKSMPSDIAGQNAVAESMDQPQSTAQFVSYARSQGIPISDGAARMLDGKTVHEWRLSKVAYAAAIGLIVGATSVGFVLKSPTVTKTEHPTQAVQTPPAPTQAANPDAERNQIAQLRSELDEAFSRANEVPRLEAKIDEAEKQMSTLQAGLTERDATIGQLQASVAGTERKLASAQATIASLNSKNDEAVAELVSERVHSAGLAETLRNEKESAERERELSAATTDVREMMGARRLFMVDVYDGDDRSRANRSFGRVFYTEGKSLVFYAFDLDKVKSAKHVTFQAWGASGNDKGSVKHLGDFYIDDASQKRWVMKVQDPEKLKAVDAIFVTVEQGQGTDKPTGEKLLYAYLGGQPNHP